MSEDETSVSTDLLHAYVDGELSPEEAARVERWLDAHPDSAAEVAEWRRQNGEIRAMFAPYEKSRPGDVSLLRMAAKPKAGKSVLRWGMAAAALLVAFGAGNLSSSVMPWLAGRTDADLALHREASSNFLIYASDVRHPVEVRADEKDHLVAWLGKRLGAALAAPDLSGLGFSLVGGRLVPVDEKAGALLMYEDETGKRLTVLIGRSEASRETSFRFASDGPVETFYWIDRDLSYAVTGEIARETLRRVADECYKQFQI
jgi:anti-sigma factor RsiW